MLGYSVSNARERGAGPSGALTEWSPHRDWLSVGTDVLMSLRLERWMSLQAMTDALKGKTDGCDSGSVRLWAVKLRNNGNNHSKKQKAVRHKATTHTQAALQKGRDTKLLRMIKSISHRSAQAAIIRRSALLPSISQTGEEQVCTITPGSKYAIQFPSLRVFTGVVKKWSVKCLIRYTLYTVFVKNYEFKIPLA